MARRVLLLGDSIRLRYQPHVSRALADVADVVGPDENCQSSRVLRLRLADWVSEGADVVHVNCGLQDVRYDPGATSPCVDIAEYEENVEAILRDLDRLGARRIIWASTTPVDDSRNGARPSRRWNADVDRYNAVAREVADRCRVTYNDLYGFVQAEGAPTLLGQDGVHFTASGYERLASRVVSAVRARGKP